jgi:Right handed beta helix region
MCQTFEAVKFLEVVFMKIFGLLLAMIPAMIIATLFSVPAQAQATRTWVSGVGDDANPCSRTAPCKTFAGAISKTAVGGEINVLDPGGFGALTITKSIQIRSEFEGGVLVSGTNGIVVSVGAADKVLLEGLDFEGLGTGLNGVTMIGTGKLFIRKCSIRNFTMAGVNVAGTANARVFVEGSVITGNSVGVNLKGIGGVANTAFVEHSVVDNNTTAAVQVDGASTVVLSGTTLTGSPSSIIETNGGSAISYGNNLLRNAGAPTQTLPLQ